MGSGADADVVERIQRHERCTDGRERLTTRVRELTEKLRRGAFRVPGFGALVPSRKDGALVVGYQPGYDFLTALHNRYAFHRSERNSTSKYTKLDCVFTAIAQVLAEGPRNTTDEVAAVTIEGFGRFVTHREGGRMVDDDLIARMKKGAYYLAGDLRFEFTAAPELLTALTKGSESLSGPPRGVALVEQVIAALAKKKGGKKPVPVPAAVLAKLTLPKKRPLPPSLRAWLAHDGAALRLVDDPAKPKFNATRLADIAAKLGARSAFRLAARALPADCILLPGGSDARQFLHLGKPDADGEYPILTIDHDDAPWVGLDYPGFDVWRAARFGVIDDRDTYGCFFDDLLWGPAMQAQADLNLQGRRYID